ncbi:MAG: hypothetical protein HYS44_02095 [Candidatus Niyogibacteria bacterium]|nr:hypothetical protein [Candidatus Niyogibacteria bacterium]
MRMQIDFGEFLCRAHILPSVLGFNEWSKIEVVTSLRDIAEVLDVKAMHASYLEGLLRNVGLASDPEQRPYRDATIQHLQIDPRQMLVGQRYAYRSKYSALIERFDHFFGSYILPSGFSILMPQIVIGRVADGRLVLANYLPPIIESHNGEFIILDGIHRDLITQRTGATIQAILIKNIGAAFPCAGREWKDIRFADEKPEKLEDRYFELNPDLFRDLKSLGIDG